MLRSTLADRLLPWFLRNARSMPWRGSADPWGILVSEVMLQQTQVATVMPYWLSFMARFPDPASLARAPEAEVLKAWEGLGYYRRARMLQRTAQAVVARHGGQLPRDAAALGQLPGIGAYTSGAVASIAFGERVPAVDGNVLRVWSRWTGNDAPIDQVRTRALCAQELQAEIPESAPGAFNESLMELGATVCTPRRPACDACPLASDCVANREGRQGALPVKQDRVRARPVVMVRVVLEREDGVWIASGPEDGLLGGLVALPGLVLEGSHPARGLLVPPAHVLAAASRVRDGLGGSGAAPPEFWMRYPFRFTHLHADFWVFRSRWLDKGHLPSGEGGWFPVGGLHELPWPTALVPVRDGLLERATC
ncbi:MAG: A/G-specific adenine glycosylase [Candidatus Sericytochromatia bacterium]|nr:A/G-specific adenine glycosylase [Candidatus Sericytochromatia bacterium]